LSKDSDDQIAASRLYVSAKKVSHYYRKEFPFKKGFRGSDIQERQDVRTGHMQKIGWKLSSQCEPPAVYKCAATLYRGAVTSSLILLEVPFYRQAYIVLRAATYIVSSHKVSYSYLINNLLLRCACRHHASSKRIPLYIIMY
jgi:hypothetical protein